jgi:hypothetical protein
MAILLYWHGITCRCAVFVEGCICESGMDVIVVYLSGVTWSILYVSDRYMHCKKVVLHVPYYHAPNKQLNAMGKCSFPPNMWKR